MNRILVDYLLAYCPDLNGDHQRLVDRSVLGHYEVDYHRGEDGLVRRGGGRGCASRTLVGLVHEKSYGTASLGL